MTIHPSLKGADTLVGDRSVLTRVERLQQLAKEGKIDTESNSAYGLPKVRTNFKIAKSKKALKAEDAASEKEAGDAEGAE